MGQFRCGWVLLLLLVGCGRSALNPVGRASTGGMVAGGGVVGSGGTGGMGDTGPAGAPCTGDQDCGADALCCDGSTPSCDVTRLPTGDGNNAGQLAYAVDDLTVRDTMTGLTWQRNVVGKRPGCSDGYGGCTWSEAKNYCASLTLGGVSGWRLPGRLELLTIADHARAPALDPRAFSITPDGVDFWTTSPAVDNPGWAWEVSFALGTLSIEDSAVANRVRCVRGGRCVPKTRFVVQDGGVVQDKVTGLVWQQRINTNGAMGMTWAEALSYCPTVAPGFRLPTIKELATLTNLASPADTSVFPDLPKLPGATFWASTPYVISPGAAWTVSFGNGDSTIEDTSFRLWVWCVR